MNFELSEEQQLLADSVRRFLDDAYDFESRKRIVASAEGWSPQVWAQLAELGVLGLPISADHGGFGAGASDLTAVMEAMGAALVVEPFLSTVGLVSRVVERSGSDAQKQAVLPKVADGSMKLAAAYTERGSRYDIADVSTTAKRSGAGWTIDGEKVSVMHAPMADKLLVSARTSGARADAQGVSLFLVDANAAGVSMKTYRTQDSARGADVTFRGVQVGADALVGAEGAGVAALEEGIDFATALMCSEAVGAMKFACDTTLDYIKTRKQFGVAIGSFQALQHRMVDMCVSTEQARSISYLACAKVDSPADAAERRRVVSAAAVKICEAARHVGQEAIQLHGGMGLTIEMKVAHAFKRLTMISQLFGDADHHLARFAAAA
jgi:pimeloyl-CoA dehydrogenase small subunit